MGFLSGAGYAGTSIKETDTDAANLFVDNYCREHPLENIADAATALIRALEQ
jgi:hypothetical protein